METGFFLNPVECPIGAYVNTAKDDCLDCPINTYQDEQSQLVCKDCPSRTVTVDMGSKSVNDCLGRCHLLFLQCTTSITYFEEENH